MRLLSVGLFFLFTILTAQAQPVPPTDLTTFISKQPSSHTYAFLWTDNSIYETGFQLSYRFGTSGAFAPLHLTTEPPGPNTTGPNGVILQLGVLTPGTVIQFQVTSQLGASASAPAGPSTITVPADSFNPPSGVTAPAVNETVINVSWTDNATTEDGEELELSTDGGANYSKIADILFFQQKSINITALDPGTSSYRVRLRAYKEGTPRTYTSYSSPAAAATTPFYAPTSLTATPLASGTINLAWADNSAAEGAYAIYIRKSGVGDFVLWDYTETNNATSYAVSELEPGTAYDFQVAAAYQASESSPVIYSGRSLTATTSTTSTLLAPTGLAGTTLAPKTETSAKLTFTDNTTLNVGYEVEGKLTDSAGGFTSLGSVADGTSLDMPDSLEPGTSYDFQIRAFYEATLNSPSRVYSNYSTASTFTTPFNAPTAPAATVISDSQINLSWTDNSLIEHAYAIFIRVSGIGNYVFYDYAPENATTYSVTGLAAGIAYDFQVSSVYESEARQIIIESARTATFSATTKDGFTSPPFVTFGANNAYAYQATTSSITSTRTSWNAATGLPAGMSFDTSTGQITGTPTVFGVFNATLSATFSDGRTTTLPLALRIVRPPAAPILGTTITGQTLTLGGSDTNIPLTDKFSDPDSESAVRVVTNKGTMDFILYNTATPQSVINFRDNYVNSPPDYNYNGSVFHRSEPGFVIQGGAFKVQSAPNNFSAPDTAPSPFNEPGISNRRGTVAMAKSGGDPNSATNQFFVNLSNDNSSNLDFQNGGFTVFARVAGNGMAVADVIAGLPTGDYAVNIEGTPVNFDNWPIDAATAPAVMDNSKMVTMTSVAPVAVLSYSVFSNSNPAVIEATINGSNLVLHALSGGQSTININATDLDGNPIGQVFTVTVNQSANAWATSQGLSGNDALPDADPDLDGLSNFHEFAFMSLPNSSSSSARPSFATSTGATKYGEITFPVRKFTTGLTYIVEASDTLLPGSWTTVLWTSTDGFFAPNVTGVNSLPSDHTMVTIRDTAPSPPAQRRFLRVRVTEP